MNWNGRIPGTPIVVDNFTRSAYLSAVGSHQEGAATAANTSSSSPAVPSSDTCFFFCTHAHTDHTAGLSSNWSLGTIYCSSITRELLLQQFGRSLDRRIVALNLDQTHTLEWSEPVHTSSAMHASAALDAAFRKRKHGESDTIASSFSVTLISSNHCPGSVMFIFRSSVFGTLLHTGDLRYEPLAFHSPRLHEYVGEIDVMYFDATFFSRNCKFPKRFEAIRETVKAIKALQEKYRKECEKERATGSSSSSSQPHPAQDYRVYLCCEGLGSEEILESLSNEFREPFFMDEQQCQSRIQQLKIISRINATPLANLVCTDRSRMNSCHFHLAPNKDFQRFAQRNRNERIEAKKKMVLERMEQERTQAAAAAARNNSFTFTLTPPAPSPSSVTITPPLTLYIKPSTQWFVHNTRSAAAGSFTPMGGLSSSYLSKGGMGGRHTRFEEQLQLLQYSQAAANASSTMQIRDDDRYGVTHILYSMHSDWAELIEFIRFMRPRVLIPINVPTVLQAEHQQRSLFHVSEEANSPSQGTSHLRADSPMNTSSSVPLNQVLSYIEHMLQLAHGDRLQQQQQQPNTFTQELPKVRGPDYKPVARENELARLKKQQFLELQEKQRQDWALERTARYAVVKSRANPTIHHHADSNDSVESVSTGERERGGVHRGHALPIPPMIRRAHSSPMRTSPGHSVTSALRKEIIHARKKQKVISPLVQVTLPPSPLDKLGGGMLGSSMFFAHPSTSTSAATSSSTSHRHPSLKVPPHVPPRDLFINPRTPFNPRVSRHHDAAAADLAAGAATVANASASPETCCPKLQVHFERDFAVASNVKLGRALKERLEHIGGVNITDWLSYSNLCAIDPSDRYRHPAFALPLHVNIIVIEERNASSARILLPLLIQEIERLKEFSLKSAMNNANVTNEKENPSPSPSSRYYQRDWKAQPIFICNTEFVIWLEAVNGQHREDATSFGRTLFPPSCAASRDSGPVPLPSRLTFMDVCIWNSTSKFSPLQQHSQDSQVADIVVPITSATAPSKVAGVTQAAGANTLPDKVAASIHPSHGIRSIVPHDITIISTNSSGAVAEIIRID